LLAQVAEGDRPADPDHQRGCPYCQSALVDLRRLWVPVAELAAQDVRAPSGLVEAVLARIRELTRDPWYVAVPGPEPGGQLRVAARVVAAVARLAAAGVPSVGFALGRAVAPPAMTLQGDGTDSAGDHTIAGGAVEIAVDITVDYGAPLHLVAQAVRRRIVSDLHRHTGLTSGTIDVNVIDVHPPHGP
jgi:uncharacterized alkaline shock family protein YloU